MSALESMIEALTVDSEPAEGAPTLLDALAHAPAAAALVVAALDKEERKALRRAHPQLRDAVGEATTRLFANLVAARRAAFLARAPTPRRWPRLEELTVCPPGVAAFEALALETWGSLRALRLIQPWRGELATPSARALAAALRRMPALRSLGLEDNVTLPDASAAELFGAEGAAPGLRALNIFCAWLSPTAAHAIAASGWRLEALDLRMNGRLGAAGVAALVAAPTFAIRHLTLAVCGLDAAALLSVANAPWPLEELDLSGNDFDAAAAGPALAALSRHVGLRRLDVSYCNLSAAGFKALVEGAWPALAVLDARAIARGVWPALEVLDLRYNDLRYNGLGSPLTLEAVRRWAPALVELLQ